MSSLKLSGNSDRSIRRGGARNEGTLDRTQAELGKRAAISFQITAVCR